MRSCLLAVVLCGLPTTMPSACADPPPTDQPIAKLLFGSCIKQKLPMPILRTMAAQRPDLVLFLGDNIYADTEDMAVMRREYERLGDNQDFARLRRAAPMLATWDDHDFGVNDGGADYPMRKESKREFLRFWNESQDSPRRDREGIYDAHIFGPPGKRTQIILLDTRYFRSPLQKGQRRVGGSYLPDADPAKTVLGDRQWRWLGEQLRKPAELRLIATSIQCLAEAAGQETWSNLPLQRQRLFELISEAKAGGVVFLSGDRHWSELSRIDANVPYPLYDLTSSSLNQIHDRGTPTDNRYRHSARTYHRENYGVIQIDWNAEQPSVTIQICDIAGEAQIEQRIELRTLQPQL